MKIKSFSYYPKAKSIQVVRINPFIHILLVNLFQDCQFMSLISHDGQISINEKILDTNYYFEKNTFLNGKFLLGKYVSCLSKNAILLIEISHHNSVIQNFNIKSNYVIKILIRNLITYFLLNHLNMKRKFILLFSPL